MLHAKDYLIHMKLLNIVINPAWVHQFLSCTRDYESFCPIKLRLRGKLLSQLSKLSVRSREAPLAVLVMFTLALPPRTYQDECSAIYFVIVEGTFSNRLPRSNMKSIIITWFFFRHKTCPNRAALGRFVWYEQRVLKLACLTWCEVLTENL